MRHSNQETGSGVEVCSAMMQRLRVEVKSRYMRGGAKKDEV